MKEDDVFALMLVHLGGCCGTIVRTITTITMRFFLAYIVILTVTLGIIRTLS